MISPTKTSSTNMSLEKKYRLEVLHEDNHTIAINKRASDIVQGDKTGDEPLPERVKAYLKEKYSKTGNVFCGVAHRLDRPTSGALVFAKTSKGLERLNLQFREGKTKKIYWAVVEQKPPKKSDQLINWLNKNEKQNKSYVVSQETRNAKRAVLSYTEIASSDNYHLLEIELETGRHHQIRCQLANIGCTIKGDLKYGAKRSNPDASIHLHARTLCYFHPTTNEKISVIAPVPKENLWLYFEEAMTSKK